MRAAWLLVLACLTAGAAAAAPTSRIVVAQAEADTVRAGDLTIEAPWMRATPHGAQVAGGYLRITNRGTTPDRLVGTTIPLAQKGEVHQMTMDNGIMHMMPVEGGLAIAPGQSVELKPGGYHLMYSGLREGLVEGRTVEGTLTFEKAGTVTVVFRVGGMGAQRADGAQH